MGVNYARRECAASRGGGARFDELVAEPAQTQIEEVILTAQKREERLQDVPITMSVFGEKTLERLSVEEFEDVTRQVPGLTHTENGRHPRGGGAIVIRGVQLGGDAVTTAFYVGETPLQPSEANTSRLGQPAPNMYDINRIEVIRSAGNALRLIRARRRRSHHPERTRSDGLLRQVRRRSEHDEVRRRRRRCSSATTRRMPATSIRSGSTS